MQLVMTEVREGLRDKKTQINEASYVRDLFGRAKAVMLELIE